MREHISRITSAFALSFSNVARLVSILLVTVFLGRSLGPSEVGEFSLLLASVAVLQSISIGGLSGAAVHKLIVAQDRNLAVHTIVAARLILIPTFYLFGFVIATMALSGTDASIFPIVSFFVGYALGSFDVPEILWMSRGRFHAVAARRTILVAILVVPKSIAAMTGNFGLILLMQGLEAALWQLVLLRGSGLCRNSILGALKNLTAGIRQVAELRRLWLSSIAAAISTRIDVFIVSALLGSAAVGQYATASRFVEAATILAAAIANVHFNSLVDSQFRADRYAARSSAAARSMFLLAAGVAVGMAVAGPITVQLLYGSEFAVAAALVPLYSLAIIPIFQRQLLSKHLLIEKMYGYSLACNILALIITASANVGLVPVLGLWGAVIAAISGYTLSLVLAFLPTRRGRAILRLSFGSIVFKSASVVPAAECLVLDRKTTAIA
ncbi:oligosaccharide flippase family protein [Rhodococcus sp. CSLK01-03]|uniref:Oligosaccharide flippase family protein n=1 Tax=Rhodococcus indonesiensis TaxID=3055869 RepID=A0ABT7RS89_9NOCA|nr:oligosaccharide flippase family protein [Rhodococcus indonesiensis]MDM7490517.1 oligosaccharide flippase family protein [Rhodococcus indonesiensis]